MITLQLNKQHTFKVGEVVHLKVVSIIDLAPGKWRLAVDDVTPLPGAEPTSVSPAPLGRFTKGAFRFTSYACRICGSVHEAKPDGSLPEGWTVHMFEKGKHFLCLECEDTRICRVCGCSENEPCEGGCSWVEEDLCSACVKDGG